MVCVISGKQKNDSMDLVLRDEIGTNVFVTNRFDTNYSKFRRGNVLLIFLGTCNLPLTPDVRITNNSLETLGEVITGTAPVPKKCNLQ
jgi:hypothetical protein